MAIGFGAGSNMHSAVNKQKANRKTGKRNLKDRSAQTQGSGGSALKFENKATPEMLREIKERKQKENNRNLIVVLTAMAIVGIGITLAVNYL